MGLQSALGVGHLGLGRLQLGVDDPDLITDEALGGATAEAEGAGGQGRDGESGRSRFQHGYLSNLPPLAQSSPLRTWFLRRRGPSGTCDKLSAGTLRLKWEGIAAQPWSSLKRLPIATYTVP